MTFKELLHFVTNALSENYDEAEALEIFYLLLESNSGFNRLKFVLTQDQAAADLEVWKEQIRKLKQGEPIQYILTESDFWGMKLNVSPSVLIPRPETEELVQLVLDDYSSNKKLSVLDIGTGSGCIALALKKERPHWNVSAIDVSENAIEIARLNTEKYYLGVELECADIQNYSPNSVFDIIVSNPPYIPQSDKEMMAKNVLKFEPHLALFAPENDPLFFYKIIGEFAQIYLSKSNGKLYFEAHHVYSKDVANYFKAIAETEIMNDMFGKPRFVKITF